MKVEVAPRLPASFAPYPTQFPKVDLCPIAGSPCLPSLSSLLALASVAQNELLQRPRDPSVPFLVLPELKNSPASSAAGASPSSPTTTSPASSSFTTSGSLSPSPAPSSPILSSSTIQHHHQVSDVSLLLSLASPSSPAHPASPPSQGSFTSSPSPPPSCPIATPSLPTKREKASARSASAAGTGPFNHLPHKRAYKKAPLPSSGKCCSSCSTNVTPEWRSGPLGPKTLCNACGLQYAKSQKMPRPPKTA